MFKKFLLLFFISLSLVTVGAGCEVANSSTVSDNSVQVVKLENPLGPGRTDWRYFFGDLIKGVMGIVGSIALSVFIAGGFMWITAAGNEEKVSKGTQAMLWATIGILVIFSSYAILSMVLSGITGAGGGGGGTQTATPAATTPGSGPALPTVSPEKPEVPGGSIKKCSTDADCGGVIDYKCSNGECVPNLGTCTEKSGNPSCGENKEFYLCNKKAGPCKWESGVCVHDDSTCPSGNEINAGKCPIKWCDFTAN
jgi:hypothetical protein